MKADAWMPLYIADYLRKTMHLTRDQHGGYMLLLMACWDRGGRLPNDPGQLAAMARATPAEWKKLAPALLPFFTVQGDCLVQSRVVEEHEKAARLSEARRLAGGKGGRPKKEQNESKPKPIGFANDKQNETPTRVAPPSPSPKGSEDKSSDAGSVVQDFEKEAWSRGTELLTQAGISAKSARAFFGKLLSTHGLRASDLLPAILSAHIGGTPEPQSYLTRAAQGVARRREPVVGKRVGFV